MTQTFIIPLSPLNNIPGVSGVDDVEIEVLTPDDVIDAIEGTVPDIDNLLDEAVEEIQESVDAIETTVDVDIPEIEFPEVELFADEFVRALTELDGFFGPVEGDFKRALEEILGDPDVSVEGLDFNPGEAFETFFVTTLGLPEDLEGFVDGVRDTLDSLGDILEEVDPEAITELDDKAVSLAEEFLEDFPGGDIILDPDDFIDSQIDRVTDGLVSEESRQNLEAAIEEVG